MRFSRTTIDWLLASLPLLATLGVLAAVFPNETAVAELFADLRPQYPAMTGLFQIITDWGNAVFYAVYLFLLFRAWRTRDRKLARFVGVYIVAQLLIALVAVRFLKFTIGRPRPGGETLFQPFASSGSMHSLPSGHTTEITGAALPFALRNRRTLLSLGIGLVIGLVGFSRIYLGWHHPTDVFFGWLLGSVTGFAINTFAPKD